MNLHDRNIKKQAYKDGLEEGISQGALQKALETARNMLCKKIDFDIICECTNLPLETVKKLAKEVK